MPVKTDIKMVWQICETPINIYNQISNEKTVITLSIVIYLLNKLNGFEL